MDEIAATRDYWCQLSTIYSLTAPFASDLSIELSGTRCDAKENWRIGGKVYHASAFYSLNTRYM